MANCDWGKPCDCIECRTTSEIIICPKCEFRNIVDLIGESLGYNRDRKGIGYYNISTGGTKQDLNCYSCSFLIKDQTFTKLNKNACQHQKEIKELKEKGSFCKTCQKTEIELIGFNKILYKRENNHICHNCLMEQKVKEISDINEKLFKGKAKIWIDEKNLKTRIKVPCLTCNEKRWLSVSEVAWKKNCLKCYNQNLKKRSFSTITFPIQKEKIISTTETILPPITYQPKIINRNLNLISPSLISVMILLKKLKK